MATLRLRDDLEATPIEEGGVRYVDVADPRSGTSMRMYEHEWELARHLDGAGSYEEVASWAGSPAANLGFHPSAKDVAGYAHALAELGFFDEPESVAQLPAHKSGAARAGDETSFEELNSANSGRIQSGPARPVQAAPPVVASVEISDQPDDPVLTTNSQRRHAAEAGESTLLGPVPAPAARRPSVEVDPPALPTAVPHLSSAVTPTHVDALHPPARPAQPTPRSMPIASQAAPPRARGRVGAIVLLLLVCALAAVYLLFIGPALAPVHVKVQPVAAARDVVRYADSKGTVKQAVPAVLSFGEGGKIVDVVPVGTAVTPGKTLATLESYSQLQKELADVRDRESFYENQLKASLAKNRRSDAKKAQAKVDEKKKLRLGLEEQVGKTRIVATTAGTVTEVSAAAGSLVAAGAPVMKIADKRLLADVKLAAADSALLKAGAPLNASTLDGKQTFSAKVTGVEGDTAHLELDESATGVKDGSEITIVKSRVPHVVPVPVSALTKSQGGVDQVFLLTGEVVRAHPVTVIERGDKDALISADNLSASDRLVVSPSPTLQDGQKATTTP